MDGNHGEIHPKGEDFVCTGVPFITAADLRDGHVDIHGCSFIRVQQAKSLRKGFAKLGDVLLTHKATLGRTAIVDTIPEEVDFLVLSPQVTYYRILQPKVLNPRYLKYYFDSSAFQATLAAWGGGGSTRAYLGITKQLDLPIVVPSIEMQRGIVGVLGALDDKIEQNERTTKALERLAQAMFRAWFVNFEPVKAKAEGATSFPSMPQSVFDALPTHFVDSEVGPMPEGWYVSNIESCSSYLSRGITPTYTEEGGVLLLNQKCIRNFTIDFARARRHDSRKKKVDGRELAVGDVLINSTGVGTLGRVAQVLRLPEPAVVDSHVTIVRPAAQPGWPYFGQALILKQSIFQAMGEGSTGQTELSGRKISATPLIMPTTPVLASFNGVVAPFMRIIAEASSESLKLAEMRDYLLPRLLYGDVRVSVNGNVLA